MKVDWDSSNNGMTVRATISGSVNTSDTPELENEFNAHRIGVSEMIVDCFGVQYLSSAAMRAMLVVHHQMQSRGDKFILRHLTPDVKESIETSGLDMIFNIEK